MTTRFWLASGGMLAGALVAGFGLGSFVTSTPSASFTPGDLSTSIAPGTDSLLPVPITYAGPAEIRCKGCGPTLAERKMAVDMAGADADGMIDGTRDPVVQDYLAQGDALSQQETAPPPPVPTLPGLPPAIERLAAGHPAQPLASTPVVRQDAIAGPAQSVPTP